MNKTAWGFLFVCFCGLLQWVDVKAENNRKPFLIPEIKEWEGKEGFFVPSPKTLIVYDRRNPQLQQVTCLLAADYARMFGTSLQVTEGKSRAGDFILQIAEDKSLGQEGYTIRIKDRVFLEDPAKRGVLWATRTLLQLIEQQYFEHDWMKTYAVQLPDE